MTIAPVSTVRGDPSGFAFKRSLTRVLTSPVTLATLLLVAALVRASVYFADRSLTLDEAFIALNVERRSSVRLTDVLDWNSAAPVGFLEVEKMLTSLFGNSEYVLRAAPFTASLVALVLVAKLATQVVGSYAAPLAVVLFGGVALASSYAALMKPYSFDVVFVLALSVATLTVLHRRSELWPVVVLAVVGAVAPAFSYASVFAIAASSTVLLIDAVVQKSRASWIQTASVVCGWMMLLVVFFFLRRSTLSQLRRSFGGEEIGSVSSFRHGLGALREMLGVSSNGSGLGAFAAIAAFCAASLIIIGVVQLARRDWQPAALLLLPGFFAFAASAVGWYPVLPRTMLFLAPTLVIFLAEGSSALVAVSRSSIVRSAALVLLAVVVVAEGSATIRAIRAARPDDGIKPIMRTLALQERRGDTVYVGYASQYALAHYLECQCAGATIAKAVRKRLWKIRPVSGRADQWSPALRSQSRLFLIGKFRGYSLGTYYRDFRRLPKRGRVWVIVSFLHPGQRRALVSRLDRRGRRLKSYGNGSGGVDAVTAYLYEF